jgi:hypothetical protein
MVKIKFSKFVPNFYYDRPLKDQIDDSVSKNLNDEQNKTLNLEPRAVFTTQYLICNLRMVTIS